MVEYFPIELILKFGSKIFFMFTLQFFVSTLYICAEKIELIFNNIND